ncbi:Aldo/keto reductase [Atractiella rhizophila]|nr:Aldo/keto reductase [Atractiella rhizophila]
MSAQQTTKVPLEIVFGGGSIGATGWLNTTASLDENLPYYSAKGYRSIDSAFMYSPGAPTTSESLIGEWNAKEKGWTIDTKSNSFFDAAHKPENLRKSLEGSLERLKVEKVRTFYLHKSDETTTLLETLKGVDALFKEGKFERFGVSNFQPDAVEELVKLSQEHNLVKLAVYQGQYNGLARRAETELFPVLRKYGIAFFAYSPTAGGFFQEKHILDQDAPGRFAGDGLLAQSYRGMFNKPAYLDALKEFHATLKTRPNSPSATEIATRWVVYHSHLRGNVGDALILGTNRQSHIVEGLEWVEKGPLEEWQVEAMENLWSRIQDVAPPTSAWA